MDQRRIGLEHALWLTAKRQCDEAPRKDVIIFDSCGAASETGSLFPFLFPD
jgi:hypothetical protein